MLGLAPDGVNALKVLGAEHTVHNIGLPVASMVVRSWTGKRLAEFGSHDGPPVFHAVWRADLYRALYDEAARGASSSNTATAGPPRRHRSLVSRRHARRADLLIGADGIRSTVRSLIDPAAPRPRYRSLLGFAARPAAGAGLPSTRGWMHMVYGKRPSSRTRWTRTGAPAGSRTCHSGSR
jgi:FAD-dependent urate hydroxylase